MENVFYFELQTTRLWHRNSVKLFNFNMGHSSAEPKHFVVGTSQLFCVLAERNIVKFTRTMELIYRVKRFHKMTLKFHEMLVFLIEIVFDNCSKFV